MNPARVGTRRAYPIVIAVSVALALLVAMPQRAAAAAECIVDGDGTFLKTICIDAPGDGDTVAGTIEVHGSVDPVNGPRTQKVEFFLDGAYILTDYRSSSNSLARFDFELPTEYWVDGTHRLEMRAITRAEPGRPSYTTATVGIDLVFDNGITEVPPNTNVFTPSTGRPTAAGEPFTVAAVGDGASGEPNAEAVADLLYTSNPNLFLYLGDVYEKGTRTEFHNWYGDETRSWGRLKSITNPTIGNHEYEDGVAPGYFDYWDNVPNFYSFDAGGWHFVNLNSTNLFRDNPVQFDWLVDDIAASDAACTIAYWHDPRWSIGTQGDEDAMQEEWELLVTAGVDIFLGGNDHNYQRWEPLGVDGELDPTGPVQFVAGSGGHGIRPFALGESDANPRVARASDSLDAFGALFLDLYEDHAGFRYVQTNGVVIDEGVIPCRDAVLPGPRGELQRIRNVLELALPGLTGRALDKATEAIHEFDKTLDDDEHWTVSGWPSDDKGKDVFDKMKRGVEKLLEVDAPPDPIVVARDAAVQLAATMSTTKFDAAVASNAAPEELARSLEHMDKAAAKLLEGEPHKAIEEYKKAWERARDGGAFTPLGTRLEFMTTAYDLVFSLDTLDGAAHDRARDAIGEMSDAYVKEDVWQASGAPAEGSGKEFFDRSKRAVEKLIDVDVPPDPIVRAIDDLVVLAEATASDRLEAAIAGGGSQSKIDEALEHIAKAEEKLANGEPHKAIEEFKKAWEKSIEAL